MSIEHERKYIFADPKVASMIIKNKTIHTIGISQWYEESSDSSKTSRIRLEIYKEKTGFNHEWVKAVKYDTSEVGKRKEIESRINLGKIKIISLKWMRVVFKIRHVIKVDPEIVIDEFLQIDGYGISDPPYMMEIEEKEKPCDFENEIKILGLDGKIKDVTGNKKYDNYSLSKKTGLSLYRIIEFLQDRFSEFTA